MLRRRAVGFDRRTELPRPVAPAGKNLDWFSAIDGAVPAHSSMGSGRYVRDCALNRRLVMRKFFFAATILAPFVVAPALAGGVQAGQNTTAGAMTVGNGASFQSGTARSEERRVGKEWRSG